MEYLLNFFVKRWWLTALLIAVGGIAGVFLSDLSAPVYLASAAQSLSVDFSATGALSDLDVDRMIAACEDVAVSAEVLNGVSAKTGLQPAAFRAIASVQRTNDRMILSVRGSSEVEALVRAQLWLESTSAVLAAKVRSALQADAARLALAGIVRCGLDLAAEPSSKRCDLSGPALDREIERLSAEAADYERLSAGVSSALRFGTPDFDGIRIRRLTGTRAVFALCGAILGAVAAAVVAWIASLVRRERELRTGA